MTTPRDFTKREICWRCCKQVADIHTCTPTPLVRELEQKRDRLRAENEALRDALRRAGDDPNLDRARAIADAALAEKRA